MAICSSTGSVVIIGVASIGAASIEGRMHHNFLVVPALIARSLIKATTSLLASHSITAKRRKADVP